MLHKPCTSPSSWIFKLLESCYILTGMGAVAFRWYPTIVLNLEFKVKFPLTQVGDDDAVPLTLGQYSRKTHCKNGRYTDSTELWTAPCGIGDKAHVVDENWREKMVCVAVGGQMGLIVPATLNTRHRATVKPKL